MIGRPTVFVRLGGCDYRCAWCDSLYAVLPKHRHEWTKMEAWEVADRAARCLPGGRGPGHATLSGGNPAIHPLGTLIDALHARELRVAIETQASTAPGPWLASLDDVTLSPKPPSSGNPTPPGLVARWIEGARHSASLCLKVVVFDEADYAYAAGMHRTYPDVPFVVQAGTRVGDATRDDLCDALTALQDRVLADAAMQDVAVLPQLHAILKGHRRGI